MFRYAASYLVDYPLALQAIFAGQIHWTKARNRGPSCQLGLGRSSRISLLCARNFDGWGVRVIVTGVKGRGTTEMYDLTTVKCEEGRREKWSPSLIRARYVCRMRCRILC